MPDWCRELFLCLRANGETQKIYVFPKFSVIKHPCYDLINFYSHRVWVQYVQEVETPEGSLLNGFSSLLETFTLS
jgi:hypothetical protein